MQTATKSLIDIRSHAISDRGLSEKRPENEDSFLESGEMGLFAVADGVGGAQAGEIASQMAIETLFQAFSNAADGSDAATVMASGFERANDAIFKMAQDLPQLSRMATTIAALKITDAVATIGHVGDSRIYLQRRDDEVIRLTADHSLVGDEIRAGRLTEEQAENHPAKNVISRALGAESDVEPEYSVVGISAGDVFLLCSDGITRHVSDTEISAALRTYRSPADVCNYLKDLCFQRGAEDNLTAIVVAVDGQADTAPTSERPLAVHADAYDQDEEPTVSLSRPFASDDDDLLELGETVATNAVSGATDASIDGDLGLFETIRDVRPVETAPFDESLDGSVGHAEQETIEMFRPIISDESPEPQLVEIQTPATPESETVAPEPVAAPTFGASYSDDAGPSESKGYLKALFALGCVIVGGLIGIGAYHFGFGGSPEPEPAPIVEMKTDNIPFSAFEKNRRNVDADPAAFLKELPPPKDAEDHYLIARASILTGDVGRAKASITEAAAKIESSDPANQKILKTEIATLQAILNDPNALKRFQSEIGKPVN